MTSNEILNAVEQWAEGYWMIRETGAAMSGESHGNDGRMDAVLVPVHYTAVSYSRCGFKQGIVGVEVKSYRQDFLKGLESKQFDKYADKPSICGLYIATERETAKTSEIPHRFGHLIVDKKYGQGDGTPQSFCVCRRNPEWKEAHLDQPTIWRLLWKMYSEYSEKSKTAEAEQIRIIENIKEVMGGFVKDVARAAHKIYWDKHPLRSAE